MFAHYKYITPQHVLALESALRNHTVTTSVSAAMLAHLYRVALDNFTTQVKNTACYTSLLVGGKVALSSVTDGKTGIWLQLARVEGQSELYLTVGQKWSMEQPGAAHGGANTFIW